MFYAGGEQLPGIGRGGSVTLATLATRRCGWAGAAPDPAHGEEAASAGTSLSCLFTLFLALFLNTASSGPVCTVRARYRGGGSRRGRAWTPAEGV